MVATNLPALFPKIAALALLSLSPGQELCVTYTKFTDSTTELEAVRYMQCQSTELTSGTPAGVFKKVSATYKLLQLYPMNTALDSVIYSGLFIANELWNAKEPQFGVGNGHIFYQDCATKKTLHFDMANVDELVSMTHEGLTICGKPEFGQTKDGLVWTKAEGCWTLDGNNLKPSGCSDVTELVFSIEALVNMDPKISQDVDQSDLKTMLVLVHSQLAPQTTTSTPEDDTTVLNVTESTFGSNSTIAESDNSVVVYYCIGIGVGVVLVCFLVCGMLWYCGCWQPRCFKGRSKQHQFSTTGGDFFTTYNFTPVDTKAPASKAGSNTSMSGTGKSEKSLKTAELAEPSGESNKPGLFKKFAQSFKIKRKSKKAPPIEDRTEKMNGVYISILEVDAQSPSGKHIKKEIQEIEVSRNWLGLFMRV
ncbi:unnamed protein product [Bursaphelenchus okinawaensis]|uniref:Uncharacterized protein n=1 Tax=Bursaphelenchus okinawaensis TaxID=465554 RepID=A0A811KFE0_9BILA|nr:unnamed protein product [Bursaphelenchus okinawaensis]CAG9101089.1 unnamed protein product [Bursaphelenchus okinawaensis]